MSIFELTAVLNHHKISNQVENGRVLARAKCNSWIDVTNWTRIQMAKWLRY